MHRPDRMVNVNPAAGREREMLNCAQKTYGKNRAKEYCVYDMEEIYTENTGAEEDIVMPLLRTWACRAWR